MLKKQTTRRARYDNFYYKLFVRRIEWKEQVIRRSVWKKYRVKEINDGLWKVGETVGTPYWLINKSEEIWWVDKFY